MFLCFYKNKIKITQNNNNNKKDQSFKNRGIFCLRQDLWKLRFQNYQHEEHLLQEAYKKLQ